MPLNVLAELPPFTASLSSLKLALNKPLTVAPVIELTFASSAIAVNSTDSLPDTTVGASFTWVTLVVNVTVADVKWSS